MEPDLPPARLRETGSRFAFATHAAGAAGTLFLADAARCASADWRLPVATLAGGLFAAGATGGLFAAAASRLARVLGPREGGRTHASSPARLWTLGFLVAATALLVFANRAIGLFEPLLSARSAIANTILASALAMVWYRVGRRWFAAGIPRSAPSPSHLPSGRLVWPVVWIAGAVAARPAPSPAFADRADVVLVVLDTLRADRCSAYGGPAGATATLDRLAREGALFERAIAPSTWTIPSHASLFTGLEARTHGVGMTRLHFPEGARTLAEELRRREYRTACFTGNPLVSPRLGLTRGFEVVFDSSRWNFTRPILLEALGRIRRRLLDRALGGGVDKYGAFLLDAAGQWLAGGAPTDRPLFVFVNLLEPHSPHGAPGTEGAADPVARYDEGVRYTDALLARLLSILERRRLLDRAFLVVTSDHGESLGEESFRGHAGAPLPATARVPLLVRFPRGIPAGTRVGRPVSLTQVAATVLGFADGTSRERDLFDPAGPDLAVCEYVPWETVVPEDQPRAHRGLFAESADAWALLEWPRAAGDSSAPLERGGGAGLSVLLQRIREWDAAAPRARPIEDEEADAGLLRDLRQLGYVGRGTDTR